MTTNEVIKTLAVNMQMSKESLYQDILETETALLKIFEKICLLVDSRFGNKQDVLLTASKFSEEFPLLISQRVWDELFNEAKISINGKIRGNLVRPIELLADIDYFYNNGYNAGLTFPNWFAFSHHFRVAKKEFTVFTGIPGHGKSEFTDALMVELSKEYKLKWAVFSPENYPYAVHAEKIISKYNGLPFHEGRTDRMNKNDVSDGVKWMDEYFQFIQPDEDNLSLEGILALAMKAKIDNNIDGVIIDPWNEIEHNRPVGKPETEYIGESLMKIRRFARQHDLIFWVVAHPSKMYRDKETNEYRCPTPYDISGSANWYNKADNCVTIYRNTSDIVEVHVQKIKFKMRGKTGIVNFNYDRPSGKYFEIPVDKTSIGDF